MGTPIIPRIIRGRLFYQIADVLFPSFRAAACAWAAAEAHSLDVVNVNFCSRCGGSGLDPRTGTRCERCAGTGNAPDTGLDALVTQRAAALTEMKGAGDDLLRFRSASRREADLAARIRPPAPCRG